MSITLNPPVLSGGGDDGTIEYACSADGSVSTGGWQISPVISGLNRNTTYYLFARVTGGRNYKDTISEIGTEWKTDKTKVAKPSLKKMKYAYTGEAVAVELNDFDSSIMGITGNTGVDAGSYQVRITMDSEDFMWSDGTCSPIVLEWKIMLRRELPAPEAEEEGITDHSITLKTAVPVPPESAKDGILEYGYALEDDSEKVENWQTSTSFLNLESGTVYYFFVRMTDGTEYLDTVSKASVLITKKTLLEKPTLSDSGSYIYNGGVIQAAVGGYLQELMEISGNTAVHAGDYTAKITLKDPKHYAWEGENGETVSLGWKIEKKAVKVKAENKTKYRGEENPQLTLEKLEEGVLAGNDTENDLKVTLSTTADKDSALGTYPITGKAAEDSDYDVTVEPGTLSVIRYSSGSGSGSGSGTKSRQEPYIYEGTWELNGTIWNLRKSDGSLATENWACLNGQWYYLDKTGNMLTGWQQIKGQWYYLGAGGVEGLMAVGWLYDNNKWYYLESSGAMAVGWRLVNNKWYYLEGSGAMAVGWRLVNHRWYYLGADGAMYASTNTPDGYEVNADGAWIVNGVIQTE